MALRTHITREPNRPSGRCNVTSMVGDAERDYWTAGPSTACDAGKGSLRNHDMRSYRSHTSSETNNRTGSGGYHGSARRPGRRCAAGSCPSLAEPPAHGGRKSHVHIRVTLGRGPTSLGRPAVLVVDTLRARE